MTQACGIRAAYQYRAHIASMQVTERSNPYLFQPH